MNENHIHAPTAMPVLTGGAVLAFRAIVEARRGRLTGIEERVSFAREHFATG